MIEITARMSKDLCSEIVSDKTILRMIDSHLTHGGILHKRAAYQLLDNFVLNSS